MIDFSTFKALTIPEGEVKRIDVDGVKKWQRMSDDYTLLDYISIPSGAWFNTGIVPSGYKWIYETEMYAATWGSNGYYYLGVRQTRDYSTIYTPLFVQSGWRMYISSTKTASAGGAKNTWYKLRSEIEDGLQNMYINDVLKTTSNIAIPTTYTLPMYLFGVNFNGGKYSQTVTGRIRYLRASKGNEVVRHFVAAKRSSDDVCGLLDLVEQKFYTNNGSGTITGV